MMYGEYLKIVDDNADKITALSDYLYDHPETSFLEVKSSQALIKALKGEGFTVTTPVAGLNTAFTATFGEGEPHIGVLCEYDAIGGYSQVGAVDHQEEIKGEINAHGCGHNLFAGGSFGAVLAIKDYIEKNGRGKVTLFGCPAEEGGGGKVIMCDNGVFDTVDAVVSWHPESMYMVRTRPALACMKVDYTFKGISAHAGANPQDGRSALDAVELMNIGANFMREHMPATARIHYAILDAGGDAPNVVQSHAKVRYMIRANTVSDVDNLADRVSRIAKGATLMTDTEVKEERIVTYKDLITIPTLQALANEVMQSIPLPVATKEETEWAKKLQKSFNKEVEGEPFANIVLPPAPPVAHGGSTDTANVSHVCPTVQMHVGCWIKGTPGHSWQSATESKSDYAKRATIWAGKAVAGIAISLIADCDILKRAKEEHSAKKAK